ncbi:MAG TPA: hypothetical protein VGF69_12375 [Thermoanaerobaculia bacterium]|jgi:hypothetical protein
MAEAACRAISSAWISANLPEMFKWKKSIQIQLQQGHEAFVVMQKTQVGTFSAQSGMADLLKNRGPALEARAEAIAKMPGGPLRLLREAELNIDSDEFTAEMERARKIFHALQASGGVLQSAQHLADPDVPFHSNSDITHRFTFEGFYFFTLKPKQKNGGGHALAFFWNPDGECRFFDANSGEWALRSQSLNEFFTDYMLTFYKDGDFEGYPTSMIGFKSELSDQKHRQAGACLYGKCPIAGFFTKCENEAVKQLP